MTQPVSPGAAPVGLSAKLGFQSVDEFCARYAPSVTRGGIYLRVREPRPLGTLIRLELRLASGEQLLQALGVVSFTTGTAGEGLPGMGIRFLEIDPTSSAVVARACAGRPAADSNLPPLPPGVGPAIGPYAGSESAGGQAPAPAPATPTAPRTTTEPAFPAAAAEPQKAQPPQQTASPTPTPAPQSAAAIAPAANPTPVVLSNAPVAAAPIETPLDRVQRPSGPPKGPIIGIDLGTTHSCAAFVKNGRPFVIPSREGYNTVPSIVALNNRHKVLIGHPAKGQMLTNPRQTVYGSKRLIGRPFHSPVVSDIKDRFAYEIVEGERGEAAVRLGGRIFSLQELSAMVLCEVRDIAQNHLGEPVQRAIITVPAYYNEAQRQAVREAGALAGLHVERILNEPTAAALAFGYGRELQKRILIYDLGGGTFDASLLELNGNIYEVISTGGDTFLGGVDFDMQLVDHLLLEFQSRTGKVFQGDRVALQRLIDAAERAKIALSEAESTQVRVPFLTIVDGQPWDLDVTVHRERLVELTRSLVERTLEVCDEVLRARKLTPADVDEVIPVGGMSRMPYVRDQIERFFGKPPHKGVHPDEAAALGAALLAHSLGQLEGVVLIDVLPMSIGIGLPGGRFKKVIERNTSLPHTKKYAIATTRDDQRELELTVFQGEGERVEQNELLGTVRLDGLPKGPRGSVKVEVGFELTAECLLKISASERTSGRDWSITLSTRDTPDEVRRRLEAEGGGAPKPAPVRTPVVGPNVLKDPGVGAASEPPPGGLVAFFKRLFRKEAR